MLHVKEKKSSTMQHFKFNQNQDKTSTYYCEFSIYTFFYLQNSERSEITPTEDTQTKLELKKKIKKLTADKILTQDGQNSAALTNSMLNNTSIFKK